jgi:transcriptional regulator with XRE-family HTH domain
MLGEELRKARLKANMTQERLAAAARIDRSYLSQLENDWKSPTVDLLFRICDAIGVSAARLLARVEQSRKRSSRN